MSKAKVNVRLEQVTIGKLHWLLDNGETRNLYGVLDMLVENYVDHVIEGKDLNIADINKEAMELFKKTRRPQSVKGQKELELEVKRSMGKIKVKKKSNGMLKEDAIQPGSLKGGF